MPQVHSRIIYGDLGESLRRACTLDDFFTSLAQIAEGTSLRDHSIRTHVSIDLRLLHKNGWVHCDLNPGNIIVVDGRPKLNDFEYARHESKQELHEMIVSGFTFEFGSC